MTNISNISDFNRLIGLDTTDVAAIREGRALDLIRALRPSRRPAPRWSPAPLRLRPTITLGKAVQR